MSINLRGKVFFEGNEDPDEDDLSNDEFELEMKQELEKRADQAKIEAGSLNGGSPNKAKGNI